jgi:nondiscriminating glutamyl-tRNA synthetase
MKNLKVRIRAAPSPTGRMHIGNLKTFVFNYLIARSQDGQFILRIEDTDRNRFVEGGTKSLVETLGLYGIEFDEGPHVGGEYGPYVQSERKELYSKYAQELVEKDKAYYCFCSEERLTQLREMQEENGLKPGYDGHCRNLTSEEINKKRDAGEEYVIRMKLPQKGEVTFKDELVGEIVTDYKEYDDQIILKSDGLPTYHFAVVVDDHLMKITHVMRGREYQSQTPKNVFLYESFGWKMPKWVHAPLLLNPDGKGKLSKRHGALSAVAYLRKGYLKEAVINYLALAGWAPPEEKKNNDDIYTVDELIDLFSYRRMKKSNARFDQKKLDYINGKHIRNKSLEDFRDSIFDWAENYVLKDFTADKFDEPSEEQKELRARVKKYLPIWKSDDNLMDKLSLIHSRVNILLDVVDRLEFFYTFKDVPDTDTVRGVKKCDNSDRLSIIKDYLNIIGEYPEETTDWDQEDWVSDIRDLANKYEWKHGDLFMLIRVIICGSEFSPPLFESLTILGKSEIINRLQKWTSTN